MTGEPGSQIYALSTRYLVARIVLYFMIWNRVYLLPPILIKCRNLYDGFVRNQASHSATHFGSEEVLKDKYALRREILTLLQLYAWQFLLCG